MFAVRQIYIRKTIEDPKKKWSIYAGESKVKIRHVSYFGLSSGDDEIISLLLP